MNRIPVSIASLAAILGSWSVALGATVNESRPADMQGAVEIYNVAGSVDVVGWDKAEVEVTGDIGKGVVKVEGTGGGNHTAVRVVRRSSHRNSVGDAHLTVHVPAGS